MKRTFLKMSVAALLVPALTAAFAASVYAGAGGAAYPAYTINAQYDEVQSPAAFVPGALYYGEDLGVGKLGEPSDMEAFGDRLYLLDAKRNLLMAFDENLRLIKAVGSFTLNGEKYAFSNPQGVTVSFEGDVYVADTDNARIVRFDSRLNPVAVFNKPEISVMDGDYEYKPLKVAVDRSRRIYVIAQGINEGLVELTADGQFMSFLGAPKVVYDPVTYFWKRILSREASQYLEKFVSTEFSNLKIDFSGFIYATIRANDIPKLMEAVRSRNQEAVKAVQKFNASGVDTLKRRGDVPAVGDVNFLYEAANSNPNEVFNPSAFVDIAIDDAGTYYCLDSRRGRIFVYNDDGHMLCAFGGKGSRLGNFTNPAAIGLFGGKLFVLDSALARITVFDRTEYGGLLESAGQAYINGEYEKALEYYDEIFSYNANLSLAYIGKGKCYYYLGDYQNAVKNLRVAKESYYCSKAFSRLRQEVLAKYFLPIVLGVLALAAAIVFGVVFKRRKGKAAAKG